MIFLIDMATIICNGRFDILHSGHFNILNHCRRYAGVDGHVYVLIDSDERIAKEDPKLPIFSQDIRRINLLKLMCMDRLLLDEVVIFNTDGELRKLISRIAPNYLVKGSEWIGKPVIGEDLTTLIHYPVEKNGISDKISSSSIIQAILDRYAK